MCIGVDKYAKSEYRKGTVILTSSNAFTIILRLKVSLPIIQKINQMLFVFFHEEKGKVYPGTRYSIQFPRLTGINQKISVVFI